MNYFCKHCNHTGPVKLEVIGLLCEKCKSILFRHGSTEWNQLRTPVVDKKTEEPVASSLETVLSKGNWLEYWPSMIGF